MGTRRFGGGLCGRRFRLRLFGQVLFLCRLGGPFGDQEAQLPVDLPRGLDLHDPQQDQLVSHPAEQRPQEEQQQAHHQERCVGEETLEDQDQPQQHRHQGEEDIQHLQDLFQQQRLRREGVKQQLEKGRQLSVSTTAITRMPTIPAAARMCVL